MIADSLGSRQNQPVPASSAKIAWAKPAAAGEAHRTAAELCCTAAPGHGTMLRSNAREHLWESDFRVAALRCLSVLKSFYLSAYADAQDGIPLLSPGSSLRSARFGCGKERTHSGRLRGGELETWERNTCMNYACPRNLGLQGSSKHCLKVTEPDRAAADPPLEGAQGMCFR